MQTLAHGICAVDEENKFTQTAEILWRKRETRPLSERERERERERVDPCLDRLLLLSSSIITKKVLIHYAQVYFVITSYR